MQKGKVYIKKWREDYDFKTVINSSVSTLITLAFALYNGILGVLHASVWHGSICVYYVLLTAARAVIVLTEKNNLKRAEEVASVHRRHTFIICSSLLFVLNLSLAVPVALMVELKRPIHMGLIPAIAMAAYTTYKVSLASVNLKRKNASANLLVRQLRAIGFIDALLSIITLQNTLITVKLGETGASMLRLSAMSSAAILLVINALTIVTFFKGIRGERR
ncbi:MAG: hypothetical protein IJ769_10505 [Clostridia bacterium]|nr:hypothetical protein [Clostridia bacterium]